MPRNTDIWEHAWKFSWAWILEKKKKKKSQFMEYGKTISEGLGE